MINYKDINDLINELFNEIGNRQDAEFLVLTYGDYLDNVKSSTKRFKNVFPVYVVVDEGEFEPLPNMEIQSIDTTINIYFRIDKQNDLFLFLSALNSEILGKYKEINGKKVLLTRDMEKYDQQQGIETMVANEFHINEMKYNENNEIIETGMWGVCSFRLYINYADNLEQANGLVYGNSVKTKLSMKVDGVVYETEILTTENAHTSKGATQSQESVGGDTSMENVNSAGAYGSGITTYYVNNAFWNKFLDLFNNEKLTEQVVFKYEKTYEMIKIKGDNPITYTKYVYLADLVENADIGELLSFTFNIVKANEIDVEEQWGGNNE